MSKKNRANKAVAAAVETPQVTTPTLTEVPASKPSIRNTIRTGLAAGKSTAQITEVLKAEFPQSQAAAKASKHIAFYRSHMKKAGQLPVMVSVKPDTAE